jgi:photosystem II stability/assembly factor-like uncharacterized protein
MSIQSDLAPVVPWMVMVDTLLLATDHGLLECRRNGSSWEEEFRGLTDRKATAVIAREGVILAGTTDGVFRSDDGGRTWREASEGLQSRHVRWMAYHPDISDREFVGTEPAGIFVSHDGGETWRGCPEVAELRDRFGWFLPYSPEAGCVRGFAFHGDRVYAAVEVGGVLRSGDAGETWRLAGGSTGEAVFDIPPEPRVHSDVHSVAGHPSSTDLVFAATAEGLYRSEDGGDTWTVSQAGMYCRGVWIDPEDADHVVLSPNDSVAHMNGRIEESRDGGRSWQVASEGLDLPWPHRCIERFILIEDELFGVSNDGRLYSSPPDRPFWRRILPEISGIRGVWSGSGS